VGQKEVGRFPCPAVAGISRTGFPEPSAIQSAHANPGRVEKLPAILQKEHQLFQRSDGHSVPVRRCPYHRFIASADGRGYDFVTSSRKKGLAVVGSVLILGCLAVLNGWLAYISAHNHPIMAFANGALSLLLALAAFVLLSEHNRLNSNKK
jgi:hypothetical protein